MTPYPSPTAFARVVAAHRPCLCWPVASVDPPCLGVPWEELSVKLAGQTVQLATGLSCDAKDDTPSAVARVTRIVRGIEHDPGARLGLGAMAREAGLSPYHFLRILERGEDAAPVPSPFALA